MQEIKDLFEGQEKHLIEHFWHIIFLHILHNKEQFIHMIFLHELFSHIFEQNFYKMLFCRINISWIFPVRVVIQINDVPFHDIPLPVYIILQKRQQPHI